jgi:hypothetical protein
MTTQSNAAAKKRTIERHRGAMGLWRLVHETLEEVVIRDRQHRRPFERALDLLFIQAFKSHGSLYSLCVIGHCEDAATIARRILELALQAGYLDAEELERDRRGSEYLAYFWHLAPGVLANPSLLAEERKRWQDAYDQNKSWMKFDKNGRPLPNWSGLSFSEMAAKLNTQQSYKNDYRFLSNAAHGSSAGVMMNVVQDVLQIYDDRFVSGILVAGTCYMCAIAELWNIHFRLIEETKLKELRDKGLSFDFDGAAAVRRQVP